MKYKRSLVFLLLFIFVFCFDYFLLVNSGDEIWNYGFAFNISKGLVPYRDFNMVLTPLYSFILALFILIFGHHLYSMYIFNSIVIVSIVYLIYKRIGKKVAFFLPMVLTLFISGYNLFSILFVLILLELYDVDFKNKDFILGLIVGLMILIKQTIGCCIFISLFFLSKKKMKYLIGVLIPCLVFLIYLLYNGALYSFIDYCFLGMFDFTSKNSVFVFLPFEVILCVLLTYFYIAKKVDSSVLLVLAFQIVTAPIFDIYHFLVGLFIFMFYLLWKFKNANILGFLFCFFGLFVLSFVIRGFDFVSDKTSYLYGKNFAVDYGYIDYFESVYVDSLDNYDKVFVFSDLTYTVKMNANHTLNKYDLINNGNMGYNGEKKYIEEIDNICISSSCLFIVDEYYIRIINDEIKNPLTGQTSLGIIKYVYDNYDLVNSEVGLNFYSNTY